MKIPVGEHCNYEAVASIAMWSCVCAFFVSVIFAPIYLFLGYESAALYMGIACIISITGYWVMGMLRRWKRRAR